MVAAAVGGARNLFSCVIQSSGRSFRLTEHTFILLLLIKKRSLATGPLRGEYIILI